MTGLPAESNLVLYSRAGCHLCENMLDDLEQALRGTSVTFAVVDIDTSPELVARYGERVPVLHDGNQELCAVRLDPDVIAALVKR